MRVWRLIVPTRRLQALCRWDPMLMQDSARLERHGQQRATGDGSAFWQRQAIEAGNGFSVAKFANLETLSDGFL